MPVTVDPAGPLGRPSRAERSGGYPIAAPSAGHRRDTGTYPVPRHAELCRARWLARAVFGSKPGGQLDVVHLRARRPGLALGDLRDRHRAELVAQGPDRVRPQRVGADRLRVEGSVERLHDLEDRDLGGLARERAAAPHAPLALADPRAATRRA